MNSRYHALAVAAIVAAALTDTAPARADSAYDAPVVAVTAGFGARSGWGGPDAAIAGGGLLLGYRANTWRFGALGRASWWRAEPGVAFDVGPFLSWDPGSVAVDPQLTAAWFLRLEPNFREVTSTTYWAFAPTLEIGARAAGVEVGLAGTLEAGLEAPVPGVNRTGGDVEFRLGVDLVEFTRLWEHISASSRPLAP